MRPYIPFRNLLMALVAICVSAPASAQYLKREPARGHLKQGETVLVDDGSCGKGKVKQVTGGKAAEGKGRIKRCIARR